MTIKKLVVARGLSINKKTGETWNRVFYSVEIEVEDAARVLAAKKTASNLINDWLSDEIPISKASTVKTSQIDASKIEGLGWKNFKTKESCKPGEAGWNFKNVKGIEELVKALDPSGKTWTTIEGMQYKLSGSNLGLVTRKPIKK